MIFGRGLLANALKETDSGKYLFYANGISNSVIDQFEKDNFEIKELEEIANNYPQKTIIYFSTCQVNSKKNHYRPYVKHKLFVEELISNIFLNYLVVRTSNLVGLNQWNTHTLFNYLNNAIKVNEEIKINPFLQRNFLDVEQFIVLLNLYLENYPINRIIEIVNPQSYSMQQIVDGFETFFCKRFKLQRVTDANDFAFFELNPQLSVELLKRGNLTFDDHIQTLLKKYYSS